MRLTKRKALQICKELWTWMLETKQEHVYAKDDWPEWEKYGDMEHDCPCCEYAELQNPYEENCSERGGRCILHEIWPSGCVTDGLYLDAAEYNGTQETVAACARAIIAECDRLLKEGSK